MSAEIVTHYRAKGLRGAVLRKAVERHARLLDPLDEGAAELLRETPLTETVQPREIEVKRCAGCGSPPHGSGPCRVCRAFLGAEESVR